MMGACSVLGGRRLKAVIHYRAESLELISSKCYHANTQVDCAFAACEAQYSQN